MSSLFAEGVDVLFSPEGNEFEKMWHGFQTPRKGGIALDGSNIREALCPIVSCGVKPELEMEISGELAMEMKNWKLIAADCRNGIAKKFVPIHIAKKGYQIFDNEKAFELMVSAAVQVLGRDGFQIATVGTVGAYSQFMVSLAIKGIDTFKMDNKDEWKQFFNLNTSHNGLIGSNRMLSALRMVCMNTILASIGDAEQAGTIASVKHTLNAGETLNAETFEKDLKLWIKNADSFKNLLIALKAQSMNRDEFKAFSAGVFTSAKSDELSTNSFNRIKELEIAFVRGDGNKGENRYDALNAWTEFFSRGGVGNPQTVSKAKRVTSANFGRGNDWKLEATRCLRNPELYAETVARGSMLYSDKLTVEQGKN